LPRTQRGRQRAIVFPTEPVARLSRHQGSREGDDPTHWRGDPRSVLGGAHDILSGIAAEQLLRETFCGNSVLQETAQNHRFRATSGPVAASIQDTASSRSSQQVGVSLKNTTVLKAPVDQEAGALIRKHPQISSDSTSMQVTSQEASRQGCKRKCWQLGQNRGSFPGQLKSMPV
jgi:hypothetical protein